MKLGKLFGSLTLIALLAVTGCSSSSKKSSSSDSDSKSMSQEKSNLVLNGDSDTGRAGELQTVTFGVDSSSLGAGAKSILSANAEYLKSNSNISVQVEGHCDDRGSIQYNLALGDKRASAVKNYLVAMGVSSSRITTVSYGKERPLTYGSDESAWSQNRRANFVVTAK